uniref:whirlin-like n=1 Tax=Styela clava TaxID=7725 RepID=UPI0019392AB7|nr:whirlin-like [Styela clava]
MASIIKRRRPKKQDNLKIMSYSDTTIQSSSGSSQRSVSDNVTSFQGAMRVLLNEADRDKLTDILAYYHRSRNVYHLVTSLENVLDTSAKRKLLPILKQVLPKADRAQFDRYTSQSQATNGDNVVTTDDSGIGSNATTHNHEDRNDSHYAVIDGHTLDNGKPAKSKNRSFGSAVRRKVKAALQQRSRSMEKLNGSAPRRRHSLTTAMDGPESRVTMTNKQSLTVPRTRGKLSPYWPRDAYDDVKVIFMTKRSPDETMGFSIRGGAEHNLGIYVSHIEMGSPADECGLLLGDQILRVNNTPFLSDVTHARAAQILAHTAGKLVLYVRSVGQVPETIVTSHNFSWTDAYGRPTSPPPDVRRGHGPANRMLRSDLRLMLTDERRVNLTVEPGQRLGLMVRGGSDYGLGIYITGVDRGSASEHAGLKPGDQILEVNNVSFKSISHADAVHVIRSSRMLIMMLRHVGRIPQCHISQEETKWMSDEKISYHSLRLSKGGSLHRMPGSALGVFQRGLTGSDQVTLRHAQSSTSLSLSSLERALSRIMEDVEDPGILDERELSSLRYYVNEYILGHVSVDALVLSLGQLLDTYEKFSLMGAIRRCLFNRDVDRFDVLILRREVDELRKQHMDGKDDFVNNSEEAPHRRKLFRNSDAVVAKPRSRSVPPTRTIESGPRQSYIESLSSNELNNSYISPPQSFSTPNSSLEQKENIYSTPRIIGASIADVPSRSKKKISPIFKNNSALLPSPMKLVPPVKPKRTAPPGVDAQNQSPREKYMESSAKSEVARHSSFKGSDHNPIYSTIKKSYPKTFISKQNSNASKPESEILGNIMTSREKTAEVERKPSFTTFGHTGPIQNSTSRTPSSTISRLNPMKNEWNARNSSRAPTTQIKDTHSARPSSPFSQALETQTPKSTGQASTKFTKPCIKNLSSSMNSNTKPQSTTAAAIATTSTSMSVHRISNNVHIIENADSESDFPDDHLPPPPMSFLREHSLSPPTNRYPVKVDVHRSIGSNDKPGYLDLPSEPSIKSSPNLPGSSAFRNTTHNNNKNVDQINAHEPFQYANSIESDEYDDGGIEYEDIIDPREYLKDVEKQKIIIFKIAPTLGLSIEGGANTRQPLPRISSVQSGGCAHMCGRLTIGQVIHQVNGMEMAGLEHSDVAKAIAIAFKTEGRDSLELLVSGPHENTTS